MLKGTKVALRPVKKNELDQLLDLVNDLSTMGSYLPNVMQSEAEFCTEFERTGFLSDALSRYAVIDPDQKLVGITWSFRGIPYFDAIEVGYRIFEQEDRSKGYATEALQLLCQYIFESIQVNRIEIRVATENLASEKIALKSGFTHEGTHKEAAFSRGRLYDMHTYALLRREWAANE